MPRKEIDVQDRIDKIELKITNIDKQILAKGKLVRKHKKAWIELTQKKQVLEKRLKLWQEELEN